MPGLSRGEDLVGTHGLDLLSRYLIDAPAIGARNLHRVGLRRALQQVAQLAGFLRAEDLRRGEFGQLGAGELDRGAKSGVRCAARLAPLYLFQLPGL